MWSSGATLLALLLVFVRPALGDPCVLTVGSLYQLKSDAVDWTMQTSSGQSCIRGLRHKRVTIDTAKLNGYTFMAKTADATLAATGLHGPINSIRFQLI